MCAMMLLGRALFPCFCHPFPSKVKHDGTSTNHQRGHQQRNTAFRVARRGTFFLLRPLRIFAMQFAMVTLDGNWSSCVWLGFVER
ncbi:hypothetical protein QBC45DRAFT_203412 [Copromyces sp. CBS 386.78]|nr:hypothetical protein QBC45DRAFT_203412 [Copromyces sp. CBS 386.78]